MLQEGLAAFIYPFCDYVAQELAIDDTASVSAVIEQRLTSFLDSRLFSKVPYIGEALRRIASEFNNAEEETDWQNIGNSCRQVLKDFLPEFVEVQGVHIPADVQKANVKAIAKAILKDTERSDSRGTLSTLISAVWDHTSSLTHRGETSKRGRDHRVCLDGIKHS
jgi:hypothetical protein